MLVIYNILNWREDKMRERICKKIHRSPQYKNIPKYVRKETPAITNKHYNSEKDIKPSGLDYMLR